MSVPETTMLKPIMKGINMSNVIYPKEFFIEDTAENWENGSLGCDERFVKVADDSINEEIEEAVRNGRIKWEDE